MNPESSKIPPLPPLKIDLATIDSEVCECGCKIWTPGIILKRVSGLQIGQKEDQFGQINTVVCAKCKVPHPNPIIPKP